MTQRWELANFESPCRTVSVIDDENNGGGIRPWDHANWRMGSVQRHPPQIQRSATTVDSNKRHSTGGGKRVNVYRYSE
jgi:hypothetical protein